MPRRQRHHRHDGGSKRGHRHKRGAGAVAGFIEPAVLLLLREGSAHGYELADELTAFMPAQRIDVGNLYRLLRRLEEEGLVSSQWDEGEAGRAKRVYELTPTGVDALDDWASRLRSTGDALARFLTRHEEGREANEDTANEDTANEDTANEDTANEDTAKKDTDKKDTDKKDEENS